ncbi:MAG: hypothetical protein Q4C86_02300 [bacterium]|nr:hypothetical protein [bacterium]
MELESRQSFTNWVYKFGISSSLFLFLLMTAYPAAMSWYYGYWPSFRLLWPGYLATLLFMLPWWPSESIGYMSLMGPGALYMSFITGNVTNLRMPATVGTINALGIAPNTDECHTLAIIACGGSVLSATLIVAIGVIVAEPLKPVLSAKIFQPAFNFVIPALFGGLVAQTILKGARHVILFLIALAFCLFFCYCTKVPSSYYMLMTIIFSAVVHIVSYTRISKQR